jgi:hypothetical protein
MLIAADPNDRCLKQGEGRFNSDRGRTINFKGNLAKVISSHEGMKEAEQGTTPMRRNEIDRAEERRTYTESQTDRQTHVLRG